MIYQHIIGSRPIFLRSILPIPTASYPLSRRLSATVCRSPNLLAKIFTCVRPFSGRMREHAAPFPSLSAVPPNAHPQIRRMRRRAIHSGNRFPPRPYRATPPKNFPIRKTPEPISCAGRIFIASPVWNKSGRRRFHKPPPPSWTSGSGGFTGNTAVNTPAGKVRGFPRESRPNLNAAPKRASARNAGRMKYCQPFPSPPAGPGGSGRLCALAGQTRRPKVLRFSIEHFLPDDY